MQEDRRTIQDYETNEVQERVKRLSDEVTPMTRLIWDCIQHDAEIRPEIEEVQTWLATIPRETYKKNERQKAMQQRICSDIACEEDLV